MKILHQPAYKNNSRLQEIQQQLSQKKPLVSVEQIIALQDHLAAAARGEQFILQAGDCAEAFVDCQPDVVQSKLSVLLQMSAVISHKLNKTVVSVGRIAGQYAKPRSQETEQREGLVLPSYRGDMINGVSFTAKEREPDEGRLLQAFECAELTMRYIKDWCQSKPQSLFVIKDEALKRYGHVEQLHQAIEAMDQQSPQVIYTSHEALHLGYEQAMTRIDQKSNSTYNLGTHFPWLGYRTGDLDGAHVAYLQTIANPIAVKVGPNMTAEWISGIVKCLNPGNQPGRLTLVHRFGEHQVEEFLPTLIDAVKQTGIDVVWMCDPMHGNHKTTENGHKTRDFDAIIGELKKSFTIHAEHGTVLGGLHVEVTGDDVTECLGGMDDIQDVDLSHAYRSQCDPRLNYAQALELAYKL